MEARPENPDLFWTPGFMNGFTLVLTRHRMDSDRLSWPSRRGMFTEAVSRESGVVGCDDRRWNCSWYPVHAIRLDGGGYLWVVYVVVVMTSLASVVGEQEQARVI